MCDISTKQKMRQKLIVIILTAIGLFFAPPVLIRLLPQFFGESIQLHNQFFLWAVAFFFVSTGMIVVFKGGTAEKRKKILFSYVAIFLFLIIIESFLHFLLLFKQSPEEIRDKKRLKHTAFKNNEDSAELLREWNSTSIRFEPFVVWDRNEFHGQFINVNSCGVRATWNPSFTSQSPKQVYVFGGSTIWGAGVKDENTIPSWLSKKLNWQTASYEIYNYGEKGYTFTQEIINLIMLLREGHRPDYVVFYDGVNDVYAAYQAGDIELIQNVSIIRQKFSPEPEPFPKRLSRKSSKLLNNVLIYQSLKSLVGANKQTFSEKGTKLQNEQIVLLAQKISESYRKSYDLLASLAEIYDFDFYCFWQPNSFLKDKLTEEELNSIPRYQDQVLKQLTRETNELVTHLSLENFKNISNSLDNPTKSFYFDYCHISAEGNQIVAEEIASTLQKTVLAHE